MITDNYIKMCEQAEEIQKAWKWENGDFVYWKITKSIKIITEHFETPDLKDFVWLPTQEQLQERVVNPTLNVAEISKWALEAIENADYYMQFNSFTELWLAFVMKEKWNKIWTGKEWREEDESNKDN